jgi:hypothetical protein
VIDAAQVYGLDGLVRFKLGGARMTVVFVDLDLYRILTRRARFGAPL